MSSGIERTEVVEVDHSLLGPSSWERAVNCTASVIDGDGMPDLPTSFAAAEGTAAHALALELCLQVNEDPWEHIGREIIASGHKIEVTREMADILTPVVEHLRKLTDGVPEIWIERRLSLPETPIHGYADLVLPHRWPMKVVDLKYGAGIFVPADAKQLGLYGMMALIEVHGSRIILDGPEDDVLVETEVIQPRGAGPMIKPHEWTRRALLDLRNEVDMVIVQIRNRVRKYSSGAHCRFCPAIPRCAHLRRMAEDAAMAEIVKDPSVEYSANDLDAALMHIPVLKMWMNRVQDAAQKYLEAGGRLETTKLVEKQARREWENEEQAVRWLKQQGVRPFTEAVISPAVAEKKLPTPLKKRMNDTLVTKRSSGWTIAPMDDRRPAITPVLEGDRLALAQQTARTIIDNQKKEQSNGK